MVLNKEKTMAQDYWGNDDEWQKQNAEVATVPPEVPIQETQSTPPAQSQSDGNFLNNILDKNPSGATAPQNPATTGGVAEPLPKFSPLPDTAESSQAGLPEVATTLQAVLPQTPQAPSEPVPNEPSAITPESAEVQPVLGGVTQPTAQEVPTSSPETNNPEPHRKSSRGVVIVVLLIIAIVAGAYFIFFNKNSSTQNSGGASTINAGIGDEDSVRLADLDKIQKALEQYYLANGKYPEGKTLTRTQDENCPLNSLVTQYLDKVPTDPGGSDYYYGYKSEDGTNYELSAIFKEGPENVKSVETAKGFLVTLSPSVALSNQ